MNAQGRHAFQEIRKLINDLNVLRRHVGSYPPTHPVVLQTLSRSHAYLDSLIAAAGPLVLGITKESLLVGEDTIELKDPVLLDFARSLFSHGIIAITFESGIESEELRRFNECLMALRQDISGAEQVGTLLHNAALEHIRVELIDYRALAERTVPVEESAPVAGDFWTGFVREVLVGAITGMSADAAADDAEMMEGAAPEVLAELLQDQTASTAGTTLPMVLKLLAQFLKQTDEQNSASDPHALAKFVRFIGALKPEVRDYFLQETFQVLSHQPEIARKMLEHFPGSMLVDALNKGLSSSAYAPPSILSVLQNLVRKREPEVPESSDEAMRDKLMVLLKEEDRVREFVPEGYQDKLRALSSDEPVMEAADQKEIEQFRKNLQDHDIDVAYSQVLLELLDIPLDEEQDDETVQQNLLEICGYFVRMGDFSALVAIFDRMQRLERAGAHKVSLQRSFMLPDFVEEILRGPVIWGKQKFEDIAQLIRRIGEPFLDPMLDRLAEEENISLRRFYVDRIVESGPVVIPHVRARLLDPRWFYVRNLVVILRNIGSDAAVPFLKTLQSHPHPKVRHEVQRTLFMFHDDGGYAMLADDLGNQDHEVRLAAIRLAFKHHTPEIVQKLVAVVNEDSLSDDMIELRVEAVRVLGVLGDTTCLPVVEKVLRSRNFFRQIVLNRLKEEMVRALGTFRAPEAQQLLARVKVFGNRDLVRIAEKVLHDRRKAGYGN